MENDSGVWQKLLGQTTSYPAEATYSLRTQGVSTRLIVTESVNLES